MLSAGCVGNKADHDSKKSTTTTVANTAPSASMKATEVLGADSQFSTFLQLAKLTGLDKQLDGGKQYSVFVPSNAAFEALGKSRLDDLKANPDGELRHLLERQVASGPIHYSDLIDKNGAVIKTLSGEELPIYSVHGELRIGGALITKSDIEAANVVFFLVDALADPDYDFATDQGPPN